VGVKIDGVEEVFVQLLLHPLLKIKKK